MKSKLALVVLAAMAVSSAQAAEIYNKDSNKLDLYGKVKGEHDFGHTSADATYTRLGFKGETQINDSLTGYGQFEHQFNASDEEGAQGEKTRLAFVGLNFGDAGSIDYGRNYGVVYDIGSYADNLTEFGGDSYQYTDNFMTGRSTGLLTYRNDKLVDGLHFAAQYQGKNDRNDLQKSNGNGYGFSLQYDLADTGATLGGAYSNAEAVVGGGHAEAWTVGAKYAANAIYAATTYGETRNLTPEGTGFADKTENFEAMANYTFDFGLQPSIGYVHSRRTVSGHQFDAVEYVQFGSAYYFNKNFSVDAAYQLNLVNEDDNTTIVGATYQF